MTLWEYRKTVKRLYEKIPFQLVYGREAVVPAKFILPSMFISEETIMINNSALRDKLNQLMELDETRFLVEFRQLVE